MQQPRQRGTHRNRSRGQGLVELVIFLPFVIFLFAGLVELGRVQRWQVSLEAAVHAATLYASKSKADAEDTTAVTDKALAELNELSGVADGHGTPTVSVALGPATGDGFGKQEVTVTVAISVPALFALPGLPSVYNLQETSSARVLNQEIAS